VLPGRSVRCPFCQAPQPPLAEGGVVVCEFCGSEFVVTGTWCPRCGTRNGDDAETCRVCGEPLTTIGRVFQRHRDARRPPQFLEYARQQAPGIKRSEGEASRQRMADFNVQESRRLEALGRERRAQAAKDRRLLMIGLGTVGAVVVLIAGALFVLWLIP
jgi:predicted amidophosphoribosyltransferase